MVDRIDSTNRAGSALGRNTRPDLLPQEITVCLCHKERPVHECLDLRGDTGEVSRSRDDDPIRINHLPDAFVDHVVVLYALSVVVLHTFEAGYTGMNFLPPDLNKLCLDPGLLNLIERVPEQAVRIAILVRTPVECNDLHVVPLQE